VNTRQLAITLHSPPFSDHYTWWKRATETIPQMSRTFQNQARQPIANSSRYQRLGETSTNFGHGTSPITDSEVFSAAAVASRQAVDSVQTIDQCQVRIHESYLRQQDVILDAGLSLAQIAIDTELGLQINSGDGLSILASRTLRTLQVWLNHQHFRHAIALI
jgi:hypothetical protein